MADEEIKPRGKRGFASMDPEKRREIAMKGGKSVPKEKVSFSRNRTLAISAGRKGGQTTPPEKRAFSLDNSLAGEASRRGGAAGKGKEKAAPESRR